MPDQWESLTAWMMFGVTCVMSMTLIAIHVMLAA